METKVGLRIDHRKAVIMTLTEKGGRGGADTPRAMRLDMIVVLVNPGLRRRAEQKPYCTCGWII